MVAAVVNKLKIEENYWKYPLFFPFLSFSFFFSFLSLSLFLSLLFSSLLYSIPASYLSFFPVMKYETCRFSYSFNWLIRRKRDWVFEFWD